MDLHLLETSVETHLNLKFPIKPAQTHYNPFQTRSSLLRSTSGSSKQREFSIWTYFICLQLASTINRQYPAPPQHAGGAADSTLTRKTCPLPGTGMSSPHRAEASHPSTPAPQSTETTGKARQIPTAFKLPRRVQIWALSGILLINKMRLNKNISLLTKQLLILSNSSY